MKKLSLLLFAIVLSSLSMDSLAQNDGVWWSSWRYRVPLEDGMSFDVRPIIRFNDNYSRYANSSVDIVLRKKFSPHWTGAIVIRPWWLRGGRNRFFIWPTINYTHQLGKLKFSSRLFYHHAINLDGFDDADFIRIKPQLSTPVSDKLTAFIEAEPFFLLNKFNQVTRIRYQVGGTYKFTSDLSLKLIYWFEDQIGLWEDRADFNVILSSLIYVLPKK